MTPLVDRVIIIAYQPLPPPDAIAHTLAGRKVGENDWRIPHLCGGETALGHNPGLTLRRSNRGNTVARCFYGCAPRDTYAAIRRALGIEPGAAYTPPPPVELPAQPQPRRAFRRPAYPAPQTAPLISGTGWPLLVGATPYSRQVQSIPGRWTAWTPYTLPDGGRRDKLRRYPAGDGAKARWDGDTGRPVAGLTPYVWQDVTGAPLIIVEGEQAAAAVVSSGAQYGVASVDGAGAWLTANFSAVVAGRRVVVWADADAVGGYTAGRAVGRILESGARAVHWVPTAAVQDAARRAAGGGRWDALDAALDAPQQDGNARRATLLALFTAAALDAKGADAADVPPAMVDPLIRAALVAGMPQPDDAQPDDDTRGVILPAIPADMRCQDIGRAILTRWTPDTDRITTPLPCGVCDRCLRWHNRKHRLRYEPCAALFGAQTILKVHMESVQAAAQFRRAQGRRAGDARLTIFSPVAIADGGGIAVTIIYAAPLTPAAARCTELALARAGLDCTLETRRLTGLEVESLLPDRKTLRDVDDDGIAGRRYHAVSFSDDWGYPVLERVDDYAGGDGVIVEVPDGEPRLTQEVVPPAVASRRATLDPEACATLYAGEWLSQMTAAIPRAAWDALVAVALDPQGDTRPEVERIRQATDYAGPSRLLVQAAQWQARLRPQRAAYQIVIDWIDPPAAAQYPADTAPDGGI